MAVPRQMTAHTLEAPKGWPSPHAVDFRAKLSSNVSIDPVFAGRCVHLNTSGEYEMGLPDTAPAAGKIYMPIFLFQNSDDPDVANPGGITGSASDDPGGWMAVAPTGYILGLVGAGAYELETTEFEPVATAGTYEPNDALTATNLNDNAVSGGRLTKGTPYTDPICGIVSRGTFENSHRKSALAFWPHALLPTA